MTGLIGRDCRITGKLELGGSTQIDGTISGEVFSSGELTVGEGALIEAKIVGVKVRVFGTVNGDIECSERLELHGGANVTGNISAPALVIQDGVTFEGQCSMRRAKLS